jgi:ankyrin repeat protein
MLQIIKSSFGSSNASAILIFAVIVVVSGCKSGGPKQGDQVTTSPVKVGVAQGISVHEAAVNGQTDKVIAFVEGSGNIDTLDSEGRTPLMYASYNGYTTIIRKLLENGASVNIQDPYGRTALMMASSGPYPDAVKILLERSADPNLTDKEEHFSALMYAASEGQLEVVKLLLSKNADPSLKDVDGDDALTFAKNNGHAEVAVLLQSLKK